MQRTSVLEENCIAASPPAHGHADSCVSLSSSNMLAYLLDAQLLISDGIDWSWVLLLYTGVFANILNIFQIFYVRGHLNFFQSCSLCQPWCW